MSSLDFPLDLAWPELAPKKTSSVVGAMILQQFVQPLKSLIGLDCSFL